MHTEPMDHIDHAAKTLEAYGIAECDTEDAACDAIRAAAKAKIAEYQAEMHNTSITAIGILQVRIDTLIKFAGLTGEGTAI